MGKIQPNILAYLKRDYTAKDSLLYSGMQISINNAVRMLPANHPDFQSTLALKYFFDGVMFIITGNASLARGAFSSAILYDKRKAFFYYESGKANWIAKSRRQAINYFNQARQISPTWRLLDEPILNRKLDQLDSLYANVAISSFKGNTTGIAYKPSTGATEEKDFSVSVLDKSNLFKLITFRGKRYHVCEIDPHEYKIELFNRLENARGVYTFSSLYTKKKDKLLFAMNGGMFQSDLSPVGLFISEGNTVKDINLSTEPEDNFHRLPNGVFGIDYNENPFIVTSQQFKNSNNIRLATQSGPMLVINNIFHPTFVKGSSQVNIRNGVGINDKGHVLFIISDNPVTFYELAELFRDQLKCKYALYLDGAISQYYIPSIDKYPRSGPSLGPILTVSQK
ncbi:phosphodiester glycosidase family protein [Spirosoma endbachense]|uniref:Phosphodiester glycosidase domain-containing protein n=1 Tax=Spirosoma endbachense TaxID=2666025 RepID=A0A6P1VSG7_9BACT|nr:phosphodiester glycosidase family protein [Spirosoma endbachense]QHV95635.1 hypothetical protein GJR95_11745 [Spirosoma endbachense]